MVSPEQHGGEPSSGIEDFIILVLPILLSHEEIKEADERSYIQHSAYCFDGYTQAQPHCIRGIPTESGPFSPLLFLVPHISMQKFNYSVSLLNISTVLNSLLIAAWTDREDLRKEVQRIYAKENEAKRSVIL